MTTSDFQRFFDAMLKEYERHRPQKGDSWKQNEAEVGRIYPTHADYNDGTGIPVWESMDTLLDEEFKKTAEEYMAKKQPHQLVDVALVCGMIWLRKCTVVEI